MNILFVIVGSVLGSVASTRKSSCPAFISEVQYLLFPDLLCGYSGNSRHSSSDLTIFGYILSSQKAFYDVCGADKGAANRSSTNVSTTKLSYDTYFLSLAKVIYKDSNEIEDLVFEMVIRLVDSYINQCTYPKDYVAAFNKFKRKYYDFDISPKSIFCQLISKRCSRTVVIIVLDCLMKFYKEQASDTSSRVYGSNKTSMTSAYASYLLTVVSSLIQTALDQTLIDGTKNNPIVELSFILLSNTYTQGNGSYIIEATEYMDKKIAC